MLILEFYFQKTDYVFYLNLFPNRNISGGQSADMPLAYISKLSHGPWERLFGAHSLARGSNGGHLVNTYEVLDG